MRQKTFCVAVEIQPSRLGLARGDIAALRAFTGLDCSGPHKTLLDGVQSLHFLSIAIAEDTLYDPLLIFDINCDCEPGHLWPQLVDRIGPHLLAILSHTTPARGSAVKLPPTFLAGVHSYLDCHIVKSPTLHHGHRGLTRKRILTETNLAREAETRLDQLLSGSQPRALTPVEIHSKLRYAAGKPIEPPARYYWWERLRLKIRRQATATNILTGVLAAAAIAVLAGAAWLGWQLLPAWQYKWLYVIGEVVLVFGVPLFLVYLNIRRLEKTDAIVQAPKIDPQLRPRLRADSPGVRSDTLQNHLVAVVHVKPGLFRTIALRLTLFLLNLYTLVIYVDGYLQSMRTIHFFQWSVINNGGRVIFQSNYDGSWDSYLDDFVEKAAVGLTAVWTHCIGFPETRLLLGEGATRGDAFKNWVLHWQHPTLFTYRAYPMSTVNQIERCAAVAEGLYAPSLDPAAARDWVRLL